LSHNLEPSKDKLKSYQISWESPVNKLENSVNRMENLTKLEKSTNDPENTINKSEELEINR